MKRCNPSTSMKPASLRPVPWWRCPSPRWLIGVCCGLVLSCAEKNAASSPSNVPARATLSQRINEQTGYVQDANGQWKPRVNRRSSFESQGESSFANQPFSTKKFQAPTLKKQSWWGNRTLDRKRFDTPDTSALVPERSLSFNTPQEANQSFATTTSAESGRSFASGVAKEQQHSRIPTRANDFVQKRRQVYPQPAIIDWNAQRQLDINSTKSMLGR